MKKIKMIKLLFFLFIPFISLGQKKGDTKIMIDSVSWDRIVLTLFENGYTIEAKDDKLKILSTKTKDIGSIGVRIRIIQRDTSLIISGEMVDRALMIVLNSSQPIYTVIQFGGMKGSSRRDSWTELEKIAKLIGPIVSYQK